MRDLFEGQALKGPVINPAAVNKIGPLNQEHANAR